MFGPRPWVPISLSPGDKVTSFIVSIIINRPYGLDSIVRLKLPKTFDDVGTFAPIPAPKQFSGQGSWQRYLFPGRGRVENFRGPGQTRAAKLPGAGLGRAGRASLLSMSRFTPPALSSDWILLFKCAYSFGWYVLGGHTLSQSYSWDCLVNLDCAESANRPTLHIMYRYHGGM